MGLDRVNHIILVLSGKGGVGKSSVTTQLAVTLAAGGGRVGVLDIDLTGPSVPRMFGVESKKVHQSSTGWVPVRVDPAMGQLWVMSLGFLLSYRGDSVVWRGPKKTAMIRQFIKDVEWGDLDYLLIDTPPGTSDEHISIAEELKDVQTDGAILVTTPQDVATADVRKEISFCRKVNFKLLGVVENMSGYVCPHCSECINVFSSGGGKKLAEQYDIPFLGTIPIDPEFLLMIERQELAEYKEKSPLFETFQGIIRQIEGMEGRDEGCEGQPTNEKHDIGEKYDIRENKGQEDDRQALDVGVVEDRTRSLDETQALDENDKGH